MATGQRAFNGTATAVIFEAILNKAPTAPVRLNPELPAELERIINKALEKDRDLRYQHASEMRTDLKRLKRDLDSGQVSSTPSIRTQTAGRPKRVWRFAVIGAVVLMAVTFLAFFLLKPLPPPRILGTTQVTNDGRTKIGYVTDGARLYYTSPGGSDTIENFQVSVKGAESVPLTDDTHGMVIQDISPEKTELLFLKWGGVFSNGQHPLWVAPVLGGAPRRVGDLVVDRPFIAYWAPVGTAAWAPDGQEIVYIKSNELHVARNDGAEVRRLGAVTGTPRNPSWSPDGSRIRFDVWVASGPTSIWEMSRERNKSSPFASRLA
jgi:hypothetical protein